MKRRERNPLSKSDKAFFEALYQEYKNFMYYIARQYTNNSADCEDVVQDATLRLLNNISTLREINRCKTAKYIVLTIRTAYLDFEKQRHKENIVFMDDEFLESLLADTLSQQDLDREIDVSQAVAKLSTELPARDWIVLEGIFLLGLSQDEISRLLNVAPDSVRMVLHRAKKKAKRILDEDAVKGGDFYG